MLNHRTKDLKKCPKCKIKLMLYFDKLEEEFTKKIMFKRCPSCLEVWQIEIDLKKKKKG